MHIGIDARMYGTAQRGIGRYLIKLIENLESITPHPTPLPQGEGSRRQGEGDSHTFTIFLRRANFEEYQPKNPNFKKALWDAPWYGWREQIQFNPLNTIDYELKTKNYIYHFPHWNIPLLFNKPFIVTIHDLQLFSSSRVRESTTRGRFVYALKFLGFKIIFRHAVLAARAIIVPSNYVRDQLVALYPQTKEKVQVIYEAPTVLDSAMLRSNNKHLYSSSAVEKPYLLYIGAAYPHKNLERLLKAWKEIHQELPNYKLVLVGKEDYFWKQLKDKWFSASSNNILRAEHSGVEKSAIFHGSATDDELASLYKHASLLVQPSLEEGFSLTPLEALSFGCPVAVSDIPVHREILQNAVTYFDPQNEYSIANTIKNILLSDPTNNPNPTQTQDLLSKYSWKKHATATLALYQKHSS